MPVKACVARIAVHEHGGLTTYGIVVEVGCWCGRELFAGKVYRESGVVSTCSCRDPLRKALCRALEVAKEQKCRSLKILVEAATMPQGALDDLKRCNHFTYLSIQCVPLGDATTLAENALKHLKDHFSETLPQLY